MLTRQIKRGPFALSDDKRARLLNSKMVRGRYGQFFPWLLALTNYNSSTRFPRLTGRALLRDRAKDRLGVRAATVPLRSPRPR